MILKGITKYEKEKYSYSCIHYMSYVMFTPRYYVFYRKGFLLMNIVVVDTYKEIGEKAADIFVAQLLMKPNSILGSLLPSVI